MTDDPVRLDLSADAPEAAVEALGLARGDAPDAARLLAIEAGVLARLKLPPGDGGGGGDTEGASGGSGGGASVREGAGASAGGGAASLAKVGAATLAVAVAAVVLATRIEAPVSTVPSTPSLPSAMTSALAPQASASSTASGADAGLRVVSVVDLPSAAPTPLTSASPSVPPSTRPASTAVDPAAAERAEVALLAEAQAALARSPAESLAKCDEHARRFSGGTLVQEREVLAIDALLRLGRRPDAELRAARFRSAFPKSGHVRRVDALLGQ